MRSITFDVHRRNDTLYQTQIDLTNERIDLMAVSVSSVRSSVADLQITADGLTSTVATKAGKTEIISVINQSAEALTIASSKININGVQSANGKFKVSVEGNVEIEGKITATSGKIGDYEVVVTDTYAIVRKLTNITLNNNIQQTQYGILFGHDFDPSPTDSAIRVIERTYSGSGTSSSSYSSWTNNFEVDFNGTVKGSRIRITGGEAGGFTVGTNYIRKQPVYGTTIYEVSLYAPTSPPSGSTWATTNAITVRHGTYDSTASSNGTNWVYDFTVTYGGAVTCISPLDNSSKKKAVVIEHGRLKYYYGSSGTTWIGEWAVGTYTESGYSERNAIYLAAHQNNVVGFGTMSSSESTAIPTLYYNPNHDGWYFNKDIYMQQCAINNVYRIKITSYGYCMYGINTSHTYQIAQGGSALGFYVDGSVYATLEASSSDKRLKKKIKPIQNGILNNISKVPLRQFEFRKGNGTTHFGAMAQDVKEALGDVNSEIVYTVPDKDGKEGKYYQLNYTEFLILRLAALEKRIEELEKEKTNG